MKIDRTLSTEIRGLNSHGERSAKAAFAQMMRGAVADLSNPNIMTEFGDILSKHGRAVTALCGSHYKKPRRPAEPRCG